jgi:hypothetical protein
MSDRIVRTGCPLSVVAYRGSDHDTIMMDDERGVFLSTDESYAAEYGATVRRYVVTLRNPLVVSETQAMGMIEIDRRAIMARGHDGRVVAYGDGGLDVVAFDLSQLCIDDPEPGFRP